MTSPRYPQIHRRIFYDPPPVPSILEHQVHPPLNRSSPPIPESSRNLPVEDDGVYVYEGSSEDDAAWSQFAKPHTRIKEEDRNIIHQWNPAYFSSETLKEHPLWYCRNRIPARFCMAFFAVGLLWITSLQAVNAFLGIFIQHRSLAEVLADVQTAQNQTYLVADEYEACAIQQAETCNATFEFELQAELDRTNLIMSTNRANLDAFTALQTRCANTLAGVITVLDVIASGNSPPFQPRFTKFPNLSIIAACQPVLSLLSDQLATAQAHTEALQLQAITNGQVVNSSNAYVNLASYDQSYTNLVVQNLSARVNSLPLPYQLGIQSALNSTGNSVMACLYPNGKEPTSQAQCQSAPSLYDSYELWFSTQQTNYEHAFDQISNEMAAYESKWTNLYTFLSRFASQLKTNGLTSGEYNSALQSSGMSIDQYYQKQQAFFQMDYVTELQGYYPMDYSASFYTQLSTLASNPQSITASLSQQTSTSDTQSVQDSTSAKTTCQALTSTYFSDYNPPPLSYNTTSWFEQSQAYVDSVTNVLNPVAVRSAAFFANESQQQISEDLSNFQAQTYLNVSAITLFTIEGYAIDPEFLISLANEIVYYAYVADYCYRALRTIAIIHSYIQVSSVLAPPADVRMPEMQRGVLSWKQKGSMEKLVEIATHPIVLALFMLIFIVVLMVLFYSIYGPLYRAYTEACTLPLLQPGQPRERNDTMITANGQTIAMQYAYSKGDTVTDQTVDTLNVRRDFECNRNVDYTFKQRKLFLDEASFELNLYSQASTNFVLLNACINSSAVDSYFSAAKQSMLTNGTLTSTVQALSDQTCQHGGVSINTEIFECDRISVCQASCIAPSESELRPYTYFAGCNVEQYIHATILSTILAVVMFILLNLGRWIALEGIRRLFIRVLAPDEYTYLGTVECETGKRLYPIPSNYPEYELYRTFKFRTLLTRSVRTAIQWYQIQGCLYMLLAVLINVPWMILTSFILTPPLRAMTLQESFGVSSVID